MKLSYINAIPSSVTLNGAGVGSETRLKESGSLSMSSASTAYSSCEDVTLSMIERLI